MKALFALVLVVLVSDSAMAYEKYVCREMDGKRQTVVLHAADQSIDGLDEGPQYKFYIEVYNADNFVMPAISTSGIVEIEEVMFSFQSDDGKVAFRIYIDELDQSSLTISGKEAGRFACY